MHTYLVALLTNRVLVAAAIGWTIAQAIKIPLNYIHTRRWDFSLLFRAGGMPSSHSALVAATAHGIGLYQGYDTPLFALAFAMAVVVIYDATGIRRQAGKHAEIIDAMIKDLAAGHPLQQEHLQKVLGHTPMEALGGVILGLVIVQLIWLFWR